MTAVLTAAEVNPGSRRARFMPGALPSIVVAECLRAEVGAVPIRAGDTVELGLREPGGILRRLERAFQQDTVVTL